MYHNQACYFQRYFRKTAFYVAESIKYIAREDQKKKTPEGRSDRLVLIIQSRDQSEVIANAVHDLDQNRYAVKFAIT